MKTKYPREQDLIPHYDKHGYYYSPIGGKVGALFLEKFLNDLNIDIDSLDSVLDLGCGDGRLSSLLSVSKNYVGVDYSNVRIKKAKDSFAKWKIGVLEEVARLKLKSKVDNIDKAGLSDILNG